MAITKKMVDPVTGETINIVTCAETVIMSGGDYDGQSIQDIIDELATTEYVDDLVPYWEIRD